MAFVVPLAIAAAAGSAVIGGIGAFQSAHAASESAKYNSEMAANNATIAKQNATWASQAGEAQAGTAGLKTRAQAGSIIANEAASGVDVGNGSAAKVQSSATQLGELDAINIRGNAARTAYGYDVQSSSDTAQGQLDRFQSGQDMTAGYLGAASSILGAAGNAGLEANSPYLSGNGHSLGTASAR